MVQIDGSYGEGGGQILRSALTLSVMTGQAVRIVNIRIGREKPGLAAQHLQAVQAAAAICGATVVGARKGSREIVFRPGKLKAGRFHFDIGTAGATSLVLQTICLPLCLASDPSRVVVNGGTHVPWSPCYHYLALHWLPFLQRLGFAASLSLQRAGFYPRGGGCVEALLGPEGHLQPLCLVDRGRLVRIRCLSAVANLGMSIAERQSRRAVQRLARFPKVRIENLILPALGRGTMFLLLAEFEHSQCCYFGLGARGKPAERVADEAVNEFLAFCETDGAIDRFLADQLVLPLAVGGKGAELSTERLTRHLLTNIGVVRRFLPLEIDLQGEEGSSGRVIFKKTG